MKHWWMLLSVFALVACAHKPLRGYKMEEVPDYQYTPMKKTELKSKALVEVRFVNDEVLHELAFFTGVANLGAPEQVERGFFGVQQYQGDTCVVVLRKPRSTDDFAAFWALGHEVYHCFAGSFH